MLDPSQRIRVKLQILQKNLMARFFQSSRQVKKP
jgi:hypothetical protein